VAIKDIASITPLKAIHDELLVLGLAVHNVLLMTALRDRTPLSMHIIELDNFPEPEDFAVFQITFYQKHCGTL
jgi:hypothetical protein